VVRTAEEVAKGLLLGSSLTMDVEFGVVVELHVESLKQKMLRVL
jgi:hypothetical protein